MEDENMSSQCRWLTNRAYNWFRPWHSHSRRSPTRRSCTVSIS